MRDDASFGFSIGFYAILPRFYMKHSQFKLFLETFILIKELCDFHA